VQEPELLLSSEAKAVAARKDWELHSSCCASVSRSQIAFLVLGNKPVFISLRRGRRKREWGALFFFDTDGVPYAWHNISLFASAEEWRQNARSIIGGRGRGTAVVAAVVHTAPCTTD